jgi:trimeric autotransporter adhesin
LTISTTQNQIVASCDGSTNVFQFPFVAYSASDIFVILTNSSGVQTTLPQSSYSVAINPAPVGGLWGIGGSVTVPLRGSPYASGNTLTISRILPLTQETSISNQSAFYPQVVEETDDTLCMQLQQVAARTGANRGTWITDINYNYSDQVVDGPNGNNTNNIYSCVTANLSGVWATDLANGLWSLALNTQAIINSLPEIANDQVFGNITGATAAPYGVPVSSLLDSVFGSAQGDILYRSAAGWQVLTAGTSGQVLETQGSAANPKWVNSAAGGTVSSVATGAGLTGGTITGSGTIALATIANNALLANISGGTLAPSATTLSAFLDYIIGSTLGNTIVRGGTVWQVFNALWQDNTNMNTVIGNSNAPNTISQSGGGEHGQNNTAVGFQALNANTTGFANTCMGQAALASNISGTSGIAIGVNALGSNTTGANSVAIGNDALASMSTSGNCVAIGLSALQGATGTGNTGIGFQAGYAGTPNTTGTNNTFIGNGAQTNGAAYSNSTALGNTAIVTQSNQVVLGNSSISKISAEVTTITAISDRRRKKDITTSNLGLEFVLKLKPVSFRKTNEDETLRYGFIAQDVEEVLPESVKKNSNAIIEIDQDGIYHMGLDQIIAPLVAAIQSQQKQIDELRARL